MQDYNEREPSNEEKQAYVPETTASSAAPDETSAAASPETAQTENGQPETAHNGNAEQKQYGAETEIPPVSGSAPQAPRGNAPQNNGPQHSAPRGGYPYHGNSAPGSYPGPNGYPGQYPHPGFSGRSGRYPSPGPNGYPGQYPYPGQNGAERQNPNPYGGYPYGGYPYRPYQGGGGSPANPGEPNYAYEKAPAEPPEKKRKKSVGSIVFISLAAVVLVAVVVLIGIGIGKGIKLVSSQPATGEPIDNVDEFVTAVTPDAQEAQANEKGELTPTAIYQKVLPSSVGVLVYGSGKKLSSEGSGVIFTEDRDGKYTYIITCAHVVSDRGVSIMVQLSDEKEYQAQLVGYDNKTDIGVVRIEAKGLTAAEFGDSEKLRVGDPVYAIGNPGGTEFANSFTAGMISAIDRPVSSSSTGYTMECLQHTAAINPGNSGGALVNVYGQVIGINSMKIVADEYEGMGFSVPSSVFEKIVNDIIANGYVTNRPKIGITYLPASSEQAYAMYVAMNHLPAGSIIVYSIASDSSLVNTQLKKGDLIVGVNGKDLTNTSMLAELVEKGKVGDQLTLNIVRINRDYTSEKFDVVATLVEDKGDTNLLEEEEDTTSYFDDYFGDYYDDYYGDDMP